MNNKLHGLLLKDCKSNQSHFSKNLFHRVDVIVSIEVAREKFLFFTGFAQRKSRLWKSCGLGFQFESRAVVTQDDTGTLMVTSL